MLTKRIKVLLFLLSLAGIAYLAGIPDVCKIDEISEFFGPVHFPHYKHFAVPESCKACHHRFPEEPAKSCYTCHKKDKKTMLGLQRAYHKNCITCHKEMKKGPTRCTDCHRIKRKDELKDICILDNIPGIYGSVTFSHKRHPQECGECHHILEQKPMACKTCHTKPGKIPGLKGAYHRKCLACHRKMKVKNKCVDCHEAQRHRGTKAQR
ncbi:MAG: cytochrome c3 family protein [bacterium]